MQLATRACERALFIVINGIRLLHLVALLPWLYLRNEAIRAAFVLVQFMQHAQQRRQAYMQLPGSGWVAKWPSHTS